MIQISPVFLRPSLSHKAALHPDLLDFHGLAIFATSSGSLLFVDLNIDDTHQLATTLTDLEYLDLSVISEVRSDLFKSNTCPAVFEQNHCRSSDAVISTLTVAVQQSLILIGFEKGQVSFYALKEMRLIHESPNEDEEYGAIKRIFIQEPGNDPKKVCYMWQCSQLEEQVQLEMFALEFRRRHPTKISDDERRMFYSELVSVGHRFSTWHQGHLSRYAKISRMTSSIIILALSLLKDFMSNPQMTGKTQTSTRHQTKATLFLVFKRKNSVFTCSS